MAKNEKSSNNSSPINSSQQLRDVFLQTLFDEYITKLRHFLKDNPQYIKYCTGFLVRPKKLIVYISKTHVAFEYDGNLKVNPDDIESNFKFDAVVYDYSNEEVNILEKVIGFNYSNETGHPLPLPIANENFIIPTNKGWLELLRLKWNFLAQESQMVFNAKPEISKNQFCRIVNTFFFDANDNGLITRHVKWLDVLPIQYEELDDKTCSLSLNKDYFTVYKLDAKYVFPQPQGYKDTLLPRINRFIELCGNNTTTEKSITNFIADEKNKFILPMRFGGTAIYPELVCEWQSEKRANIRPDFFLQHTNGFADIVEFKLPNINSPTVGIENREGFSAQINSYISQLRVYSEYFDDPNNRQWFENKYGFKVHKPKRILIAGRRADFESTHWREIQASYPDVEIHTYDDLIDSVMAQFYYSTEP